jgi:hypothetical protein
MAPRCCPVACSSIGTAMVPARHPDAVIGDGGHHRELTQDEVWQGPKREIEGASEALVERPFLGGRSRVSSTRALGIYRPSTSGADAARVAPMISHARVEGP